MNKLVHGAEEIKDNSVVISKRRRKSQCLSSFENQSATPRKKVNLHKMVYFNANKYQY